MTHLPSLSPPLRPAVAPGSRPLLGHAPAHRCASLAVDVRCCDLRPRAAVYRGQHERTGARKHPAQ